MKLKFKERSFSLKFDDLKAGDCFYAHEEYLYMKINPTENESDISKNAVSLDFNNLECISKTEPVSLFDCELVEL